MSASWPKPTASSGAANELSIPNDWRPRGYQLPVWRYLERGGRRALMVWHRRSGKDAVCLNWTATQCMEQPRTYWHMLPQAEQARKAIWDAVDEFTGERIIDRVFPPAIRKVTRSNEMFIQFQSGATWQLVGSDNYNRIVGSPPFGIVFSEYALAKPSAWDFIRPILRNNDGWAVFNSTPRGHNHLYRLHQVAEANESWFSQVLTVRDTLVLSMAQIEAERREGMPEEMIEQEYFCSFEAANVGAYYARKLGAMRDDGRFVADLYDDALPVIPVFDLGYDDDTAIWFMQVHRGEVRFIDCYAASGQDVQHYADVLTERGYRYEGASRERFGEIWLPHDGKAKTLASPRSVEQQFREWGFTPRIVPNLSMQDGIQALRQVLNIAWFDTERCGDGIEALMQYQREWEPDKMAFKDRPLHDWTSHYADAARYAAVIYRETMETKAPAKPALYGVPASTDLVQVVRPTFDEALRMVRGRNRSD